MFRQILRISNTNDAVVGKGYEISQKLLSSAFKPITFALNHLVFSEVTEISNRDDTYLRFYFENLRDLLSYLGKRIELIKQESNQLYLICRMKEQIKIVFSSQEINQYVTVWSNLFINKRKMIKDIEKKEKNRFKQEKRKKQEQKIK